MNKGHFLSEVKRHIQKHPTWIIETSQAIQQGIVERIQIETQKRAEAETALSLLVGNFENVPEYQKEIVVRALINSHMFGGTQYANELEAKYLKKEQ